MSLSTKGWPIYRRLLGYMKKFRTIFFVGILSSIMVSMIEVLLIKRFEPLINDVLQEPSSNIFLLATLFIIAAISVRGIAAIFANYCMTYVGRQIVHQLRIDVFQHYLKMPVRFFDENTPGDLVSKLTFNTETVAQSSTQAIKVLATAVAAIVYALYSMAEINLQLTFYFLIAAPLIAWTVRVAAKRFRALSHGIQDSMGNVTQVSNECVSGIRLVKVFGGQDYEELQFKKAADKNLRQTLKMALVQAISSPLTQWIAGMGLAFVFWLAGQEFMNGDFVNETTDGNTGQFVAFFMLLMYLLNPLKALSSVNSVFQKGISGAESLFRVIDSQAEAETGHVSVETVKGALKFNNISFSYDGKNNVIEDFNLTIEPGQTVALVGPTGSGKSTITNLLLRFYQNQTGSITLDNRDIADFSLKNYRSHFAYVPQQVLLFNDSIRANIAYGELSNTHDAEIQTAVERANLSQFIEKLEEGWYTQVGQSGDKLSGGQKQRIAIARALLKNAPILILDEATSALDNETEKVIQSTMDTLMKHKTTLVIAHRLSTIEKADKIVVMHSGKIIEVGTHQELLDKKGEYQRLYDLQFSEKDN